MKHNEHPDAGRVIAVIAVYNPAADLAALVASCAPAEVLLVDDGSTIPVTVQGVQVLRKEHNRGLASSLNMGLEYAASHGFEQMLTLDQDTSLPPSFVIDLTSYLERACRAGRRVGAIGPRTFGRLSYPGPSADSFHPADEIIQSGMLLDVDALQECGGFDESLFIDGVDTDVCLKLALRGYEVLTVPLAIDHEIGHGRTYSILGRDVLSTGHSAVRRYFIARNRLVLLGRYGRQRPRWAAITTRRLVVGVVLAVTVERHRLANLAATYWGALDALLGRTGPLRESRRARLERWSRSR